MFTFSAQEYKWCVECHGNIRKDAYYCRFCRKPVGSKILAAKAHKNVSGAISAAAQWLPNFTDVLDALPAPFRARIDEADASTPAPYIGLKPGVDPSESRTRQRNSSTCSPTPPTKAALGLILDVLISLHAHEVPISTMCSEPRLQLLELTRGEIIAEYELRISEIEGAQKCVHCSEFIRRDEEQCRFCGGTEKDVPPKADDETLIEINRFDPTLLRSILIWEAATRRIQNDSPISAEILSSHGINEEEIDLQILKLRQNPKILPKSRWRERMLELEISPGYFEEDQTMRFDLDIEYFMLQDVTSLARALTPSYIPSAVANIQEALIVVEHGLTRWQNHKHYQREEHALLSAKASMYMNLKDDENYKKYKKEADQVLLKSLPEEYRDVVQKNNDEDALKPLMRLNLSADPEERLKLLEERKKEILKRRNESIDRLNKLSPGLADVFQGIGATANRIMQISTHLLKGQTAMNKSDPETACTEFEAAIALVGDDVLEISKRCNLLLNLGEAQFKKGDIETAEATFQRALSDAADVAEAKAEVNPSGQAHHKYACFLRDTGHYDSAEEHFKKAFAGHAQVISQYIEKGYMPADSSKENWLMKEDFAKLLRAKGSTEEADREESESKALKEKDKEKEKDSKG